MLPGLVATACSQDDVSTSVKRPAAQRPDIDKSLAAKGSLLLPASEEFNYTAFTSGQTGSARGESAAVSRDGARCAAQAGQGGTAWAEFQMGHCFDNTSGLPLDAVLRLRLKATESRSFQGSDADPTESGSTAAAALRFFIKDSNGQMLRNEDLLTSSLAQGPQSSTNSHDVVFDVRFEPDRGYYLIIAGRAECQAGSAKSTSVSIDVASASMDIRWRAAAAEPATTAGPPAAGPASAPAPLAGS
jgi:hypothetical protein